MNEGRCYEVEACTKYLILQWRGNCQAQGFSLKATEPSALASCQQRRAQKRAFLDDAEERICVQGLILFPS